MEISNANENDEISTPKRQKIFLRSIRMYATRTCIVAIIGTALMCVVGRLSGQYLSVDAPRRSVSNTKSNNKARHLDKELISKLKEEFHEWTKHHGRDYGSDEEKEKRFHVWKENHFRTIEKNARHGPCQLTGKAVFGSNHFKDLSQEEFKSKYLTGYTGPHTDQMKRRKLRSDEVTKEVYPDGRAKPSDMLSSNGLHDPTVLSDKISRHESVHERYLKHVQETPKLSKTYYNYEDKQKEKACKCGTKNSSSTSNNYYNSNFSSDYYNFNYKNYYGNRKLGGIFSRHSPLFGKTYYNKSEKQKICGTSYGKSYYNKNSGSSTDCSKYKLEADFDYTETSNKRQYSSSCDWYDMSCWLQDIFTPLYGVTSEDMYKNYNYPSSIDWRKVGAITNVHSQGSCGACWAITAVETIEAANYINTGTLVDLAETEVIICEESCQTCDGGWPQNAYDYVEEQGGLPTESSSSYDGDFLMTLTAVLNGESDEMTDNEVEYIKETNCPSDGFSSSTRYGAIKGYAYATDRCVCYTDGSGCDCDDQNEALAVMNIASYGPATVCLEASLWQDYTGGIITTDSGCTSAFLDMNHCVQVVGYAYTDVTDDDNEDGDNKDDKKEEDDQGHREGYWIVRNQWSSYWGMNGYAYVAMGSNTCGILNDMTQVFME